MTTRFKGITLTFAEGEKDVERVVPPLNFRSLQQLQTRLEQFSGRADPASIDLVVDCLHHALARNYPAEFPIQTEGGLDSVGREKVRDMLDLENMMAVMEAVMDVSGLKRKAKEAEAANGDPSTGATATPN